MAWRGKNNIVTSAVLLRKNDFLCVLDYMVIAAISIFTFCPLVNKRIIGGWNNRYQMPSKNRRQRQICPDRSRSKREAKNYPLYGHQAHNNRLCGRSFILNSKPGRNWCAIAPNKCTKYTKLGSPPPVNKHTRISIKASKVCHGRLPKNNKEIRAVFNTIQNKIIWVSHPLTKSRKGILLIPHPSQWAV